MKFVLYVIIFVVLFLAGIRYIERHSIFFPMKEMSSTPKDVGLSYEDIYFTTIDNKKLNGWFIPAHNAEFTLMFVHGNAGNIGHRLEKILLFHVLGLNVFIFDYRGYGKSEGAPSEKGVYKDIDAAYLYLTDKRRIPKDRIILYGESIGGAVAIDLASREEVRGLITEETFSSVKDMAKMAYPVIPHFVFSARFNSVSKIGQVSCPKLIIHSVDDEIVPFYLGEKLLNAAKPPKKFLKVRGSHNTAFFDSKEEFVKGIQSFVNEL